MDVDKTPDDVARALRRLALLYRHFAETLQEELGPEPARKILAKAMYAYGGQIGREARARTEAAGLDPEPGNFMDDLPSSGWRTRREEYDGERVTLLENCPLADEWRDMDPELARLYCLVDPAKMEVYNPAYTLVHVSNTLNGDGCCRIALRRK